MQNEFLAATLVFKPYSLDEALDGIARTGFKSVEIGTVKDWLENVDPETIGSAGVPALQAKFDEAGLKVRSISGHTHLHTRAGAKRFRKTLDLAANLGIDIVNTYTGDAETEEEREQFFIHMRELADYAAALGITIAVETDGNMLPNAAEGHWILDRIDHPTVRMNYDTGNVIYFSGARPEQDIRAALPYLAHVHLKDKRGGKRVFDFPQLGTGEIDIAGILRTLEEAGYTGPISTEVEFAEFERGTWPDFDTCVQALQGSWDYLVSLGVTA